MLVYLRDPPMWYFWQSNSDIRNARILGLV